MASFYQSRMLQLAKSLKNLVETLYVYRLETADDNLPMLIFLTRKAIDRPIFYRHEDWYSIQYSLAKMGIDARQ